jgi:hypothetical protein
VLLSTELMSILTRDRIVEGGRLPNERVTAVKEPSRIYSKEVELRER